MTIDEAIKQLKRGDERAFELIYKEYFSRMRLLSKKIVGDADIAEDIVQQTFFLLWEKRSSITIEKTIGGYLARSVYNLSLQHLRNNNIHGKHHGLIYDEMYSSTSYFEQQLEFASDDENLFKLKKGLEELPEQCRNILMMSRFDNKKSSDIASELGLSTRTVENQLYIGLKKLKNFITK